MVFGFGQQLGHTTTKAKASRRFCVNGGTLCPMFTLNLYVDRKRPSKLHIFLLLQGEAVKRLRLLQHSDDCYDEYTTAVWMSQRKIFFFKVPPSADWLLKKLKSLKMPESPRHFYWLNILVAGSFCTMEKEWKMNCRVAASFSRFLSRETPQKFNIKYFQVPRVRRNEPHYQW